MTKEGLYSLNTSNSEENMTALHKYMQMNTGELEELFKVKDNTGTRTNENESAMN